MYKLNTDLSNEDKRILTEYTNNDYEILPYIEGESFVFNDYGDYLYNECFEKTEIEFFAKQRYKKIIPYTIIKFYNFYLMNTEKKKNIWYRGRKDTNGNIEYDCYVESLEEAFMSL